MRQNQFEHKGMAGIGTSLGFLKPSSTAVCMGGRDARTTKLSVRVTGESSPTPRKFYVSGEAEMIFLKEFRFCWLKEKSGMLELHCLNSPSSAEEQMQKC